MMNEDYLLDAIRIRHHLHEIAELKFEEEKTSSFIASTLTSYGYQVKEGIAGTGVLAVWDSGKPGKTIAFRAEMDALPIQEKTGLAYASQQSGIMHACGHDGHMATLLLFARHMANLNAELRGKVKFIFQPAEEGGKGSSKMIEAGVLESPHVDAIFGFHNWPGLPKHTLATRTGCILAGSGRFEIEVLGKRAHLARPQDGINPITLGASIVQRIEALKIPNATLHLIGFNSGDWKEGASERADIVGCYFVETEEALSRLKKEVLHILGAHGRVEFHEFQPATLNSPKETDLVISAARKSGMEEICILPKCEMVSDDFSEYLLQIAGCYFLIGAGEKCPPVHTAEYNFPDEIINTVARLYLQITKDFLVSE